MLEKFLNKKVIIIYTAYTAHALDAIGVVTAVDENFIELDNNKTVSMKYIVSVMEK